MTEHPPLRPTLVVDISNVVYRIYFALARDPERVPPALPETVATLAVAVILDTANKLPLRGPRMAAGDTVAVWDGEGGSARRRALDPRYKEGRQARPSELGQALELVCHTLGVRGVRCLEVPGYEADDVIGTYAAALSSRGQAGVLLSTDKDLLQLLDEHISVLAPKATIRDLRHVDRTLFHSEYGILPGQLPTWKALRGDASDGIVGVHNIGPKTASLLVAQYGDLETILRRAALGYLPLSSTLNAAVAGMAEQLRTNLVLATIDRAVPGVDVL